MNYPRGKLNENDEGQTALHIGIRDSTVIIEFQKPMLWLGLGKQEALGLAKLLTELADKIQEH